MTLTLEQEMFLLDHFAMTAMAAYLNTPVEEWPEGVYAKTNGRVCAAAYDQAEAMLRERNARYVDGAPK